MQKNINYSALLLVITFGVSAGNLLSSYLSTQFVAYQLSIANQQRQEQREITLAQQHRVQKIKQEAARDQRRQTSKGKNLRRHCEDWKSNHLKLQSEISKSEMLKACDAYVKYVTQGY